MKRIYPALLLFILAQAASAQCLEEVNFSPATGAGYSTYCTGINNHSFVTGYYNVSGTDIGYTISPAGKIQRYFPTSLGAYTGVRITGINDSNRIAIQAVNSGTYTVLTATYDAANDTFINIQPVTDIQAPGLAQVQGISRKSGFVGWYQGTTSRYFWLRYLDPPVGQTAWQAHRYYTGTSVSNYVYYNTMAFGANDSFVVGYYLDLNNWKPFVFNKTFLTFVPITNPASTRMRIYGINKNNVIVGDYQTGNGTLVAYRAQYNGGGNVTTTSLAPLFENNTIQSIANGVNDKGEIVGSYMHPVSGTWVGFIYRPGQDEYRIPGFSYAQHTLYKVPNSSSHPGTNDLWTPAYWGGSNYATQDPYANNGTPLWDNLITLLNGTNLRRDSLSPTWKGYMTEADKDSFLLTHPVAYNNGGKYLHFAKYLSTVDTGFTGYCYGFSYTALMRYYRDSLMQQWFGLPQGLSFPAASNTNKPLMQAIERNYLKQLDDPTEAKYKFDAHYREVGLWNGLYRTKMNWSDSAHKVDPRSIAIDVYNANYTVHKGYHNILPYKIRTPKKFPFNSATAQRWDTLFVYDSSRPTLANGDPDSTQHIIIRSGNVNYTHDSAYSTGWYMGVLNWNKPSIKESIIPENAQMKTTGAGDLEHFEFSLKPGLSYSIRGAGTATTAFTPAAGFTTNDTGLAPVWNEDVRQQRPLYFIVDTLKTLRFQTEAYTGPMMVWNQSSPVRTMSLTRTTAAANETDYGSTTFRRMTYGTHNAATKSLNGMYVERALDWSKVATIAATGLSAANGDSFLTENPAPFQYKITKLVGAPTTYNLTVYTGVGNTPKHFVQTGIPLGTGTTHIIDPFFAGATGTQTVVYVDNGSNGSYEDTLFITEVPAGIGGAPALAGNVRLYPNPATSQINLTLDGVAAGSHTIGIYDIRGALVRQQQVATTGKQSTSAIPLAGLAPGVYALRVLDERGRVLHEERFVKE